MTVTLLRRSLILIIVIALLVNVILVVYGSFSGSKLWASGKVKLLALVESESKVPALEKKLKELGYEGKRVSKQGELEVFQGYAVTQDYPKTMGIELARVLTTKRYKIKTYEKADDPERTVIQIGNVCADKKSARAMVDRLFKEGFQFSVTPSFKNVPAALYGIEIENLDKDSAESLKEKLKTTARKTEILKKD